MYPKDTRKSGKFVKGSLDFKTHKRIFRFLCAKKEILKRRDQKILLKNGS